MKVLRHIPNTLTSLNLATGCVGIIMLLAGEPVYAAWFVWISCAFDFFDGFVARLLKVSSPIGKELDSLADMVSFGVLPAVQVYLLFTQSTTSKVLPFFAISIAVFSALRLAKFNLDTRQTNSFIGVPTPANALFITALLFLPEKFQFFIFHPVALIVITLLTSLWLIMEVELFALKFTSFRWKDNQIRFTFLALAGLLIVFFKAAALVFIILMYVLLSLFNFKKTKKQF
ncbi:MAG: CDP-diacylglycerol--serine O-phosphatidyltransferase [Cyclobacteriaceae bacterium]|nr:CDP-diacylglycerol--serine O-phosphatidyltransferase [Cyclobacteriaceae bacterium]